MRLSSLLLPCALVALAAAPAEAAWPAQPGDDLSNPANWPSDPGYGGQWNLWSFMPTENIPNVTPYEASVGSGIHADEAWETTTGRSDVLIAELDSGIRWGERDLVNKFYLNRGELPAPQGCGSSGSDPYDVNNDGVFNVQDYTTATGHAQPDVVTICDSRVADVNGNGFLDPQDLIKTFSDGTDDDGNGWTDDIAGWDAYHDDNDPMDDTDFGHGTGEAKDSAAEADNGIDDAGVCPRCMVMPVRVGDAFVAESNDFATAAFFAVDSGAKIIQEALGTLNGTPASRRAIEYAWEHDVVIVASAGDENSFHAELPGSNNHTIYVHATRYDTDNRASATTFMAFNNCTNYGAQLLLSTPGTACSSEATGKTSGAVGLILSAGLDHGVTLLPEEVKQLLLENVDDIYNPDDATNPQRYTTLPGWEKRYGYGRTNVGRAVQAVVDDKIPPVVDVMTPTWFSVVDPATTPMISITGEISFRDTLYDSYDWVVEWAPGIEPAESDWTEIASGTNETQPKTGELGHVAARDLEVDNAPEPEPDLNVNRYMVTVRVRVTLHAPGQPRDGTKGEIRRAFHVHHDDDVVAGFPVDLGGSADGSAKVTDLDGDGKMEIVYGDSGGHVHAFEADGTELAGWPVDTDVLPAWSAGGHVGTAAVVSGGLDPALFRTPIEQGIAVGDLDGSGPGGKDVVAASVDGYVYAWDASGALVAGFPVELDRTLNEDTTADKVTDSGVFGAPVLEDLDGDGALEIIAGASDSHVYAWHADGTTVAGFPVLLKSGAQTTRIIETPSVGDIDGDGSPEIVTGTNEFYNGLGRLYAIHADGSLVAGWPISVPTQDVLPVVGVGVPNNTALADVDGDGVVDIAYTGIVGEPTIVRGDTSTIGIVQNSPFGPGADADDEPTFVAIANGSFGDLDNDHAWDVIWPGIGSKYAEAASDSGHRVDFDHELNAWSTKTLQFLPGFPRRMDDHQFFMNPAVADVDGDGFAEVIAGSGGYFVHAANKDGTEPAGWPKFTGGWITSSPAVGDLDGDGLLEVVASTREGTLWAWHTTGKTDGHVDWASFHHDDRNTGNMDTPIGFGGGGGGDGGCCDASGGDPRAILLLAIGIGLVLSRPARRRR